MGLGVIIVLGSDGDTAFLTGGQQNSPGLPLDKTLCCVDVLGRPTLERTLEQFLRLEVEQATILAPVGCSRLIPPMRGKFASVSVQCVSDLSSAVTRVLGEYSQNGIENSFLISGSLYVETDLLDLFFFHREAMHPVTRAVDQHGTLNLWVIECERVFGRSLEGLLTGRRVASYLIGGYVKRLEHVRDLRVLISDALSCRSAMRPSGHEVRPGIWIDQGAEVDRRARLVAPAYIGRRSKVKEDALITRRSSIEHDCCIDYGTAIENSSILANTSVGIWLDVRYAVASGDQLYSLSRDVTVEIADPGVMRSSVPVHEVAATVSKLSKSAAKHSQKPELEPPTLVGVSDKASQRTKWQLGANFIQG